MSDQDELLKALEVHGQQFLQSFCLPAPGISVKRKAVDRTRPSSPKRSKLKVSEDESSSDEEWTGIQAKGARISEECDVTDSGSCSGGSEFEQEDDDLTVAGPTIADANVVVFSESGFKKEPTLKAQANAFMSSKVSRIRDHDSISSRVKKEIIKEEEEERTNAENDALLHKLVHTQLLSGSLNSDLDMTPAHRRKALAGRVMELAGGAKMGKGENAVRQTERNRASKNVREGLARKQKGKEQQELDEAKNLGNYHPALKKLFGPSGAPVPRSRPRGLKMGVGKFRGGVLQLRKQDIAAIGGKSQQSSGKRSRGI